MKKVYLIILLLLITLTGCLPFNDNKINDDITFEFELEQFKVNFIVDGIPTYYKLVTNGQIFSKIDDPI